jgi:hypothetical protein
MKRRYLIAVVTLAALFAGTGLAWAIYTWTSKDSTEVGTAPNLKPIVTAQDGVSGLYPGASQPYSLKIKNPNPYSVRVTYLEGFNAKTKSGCQDHAITIDKNDKRSWINRVIPGGSTITVKTRIVMKDWAKASCANRTLTFNVTVKTSQK